MFLFAQGSREHLDEEWQKQSGHAYNPVHWQKNLSYGFFSEGLQPGSKQIFTVVTSWNLGGAAFPGPDYLANYNQNVGWQRLSQVNCSKAALIADARFFNMYWQQISACWNKNVAYRHPHGGNVVMLDGHVESIPLKYRYTPMPLSLYNQYRFGR